MRTVLAAIAAIATLTIATPAYAGQTTTIDNSAVESSQTIARVRPLEGDQYLVVGVVRRAGARYPNQPILLQMQSGGQWMEVDKVVSGDDGRALFTVSLSVICASGPCAEYRLSYVGDAWTLPSTSETFVL